MKKKLITILVTSIIMLGLGGVLLWRANTIAKQRQEESQAILKEERDVVEEQKGKAIDDVSALDIQPLYTSGDKKNVVTVSYSGTSDIYNQSQSARAEKNLTDIKDRRDYMFDSPLWAYNPYGTNPLGMYVYFKTTGNSYCRYTISVKDSKIPDFTRTLDNGSFGRIAKEHEGQIIGLVPGKTNYIILKMYNNEDELSQTATFEFDVPNSPSGADLFIQYTDGRSDEHLSNGLYTVFGDSIKGSKRAKAQPVLFYDNSGVLRAEFPSEGYVGNSMVLAYDNIVYPVSENKLVQVNSLGQVVKTYNIIGYNLSGEIVYDDAGNIYMIATKRANGSSVNGCVLRLEMSSGEVTLALNMEKELPDVYNKIKKESNKAVKRVSGKAAKKAAKKEAAKEIRNWVNLNSIQVAGTNKLLVSSGKLSSIFKISNAGSMFPKIDYIIADKKLWKDYKKYRKLVLQKTVPEGTEVTEAPTPVVDSILDKTPKEAPEPFASQYGQNAISISRKGLGEGQYYLSMLNNNIGTGSSGNRSYYYRFQVDENSKTYILKDKKAFEKSSGGNMVKSDGVYLYCQSSKGRFIETDSRSKLIRSFVYSGDLYRVYKNDWKDFWFD